MSTFNFWLKSFAQQNDYPLVDFDSLLADQQGYLTDTLAANLVEPNTQGYYILTEAIAAEMKKSKGNL